jgi:hypothetical protein
MLTNPTTHARKAPSFHEGNMYSIFSTKTLREHLKNRKKDLLQDNISMRSVSEGELTGQPPKACP